MGLGSDMAGEFYALDMGLRLYSQRKSVRATGRHIPVQRFSSTHLLMKHARQLIVISDSSSSAMPRLVQIAEREGIRAYTHLVPKTVE